MSDSPPSSPPSSYPLLSNPPMSASPHTPSRTYSCSPINPHSSAERDLARTAGMRIDTPTPYPRLLLEPRLAPSPSSPPWTARRLAARHRHATHPIPISTTTGTFAASIAQLAGPVALPPSYLFTAHNALTPAQLARLQQVAEYGGTLPLFVYGHWQLPAQLAGVLSPPGSSTDPATLAHWTRRMVPATLRGWNRYCIRGGAPTAAVVPHGCTRTRYYVRDVVEQEEGVEGRLVVGVTGAEWGVLDGVLGVGGAEAVFERREVEVVVGGGETVRAACYVWVGDVGDLHVFRVDRVWTLEGYVDWYCSERRERMGVEGGGEV